MTSTDSEVPPSRELDEATVQVLKDRAREVASRKSDTQVRGRLLDTVVVKRAGTLLGLPIDSVREIRHVSAVKLPHGTAHVPGLFQVRGKVFCLADLQPFFGTPNAPDLAHLTVAIVGNKVGDLGIRVDEVIGPRTIYADEKNEELSERSAPFVSAVTSDLLIAVDIDLLFQQPQLYLGAAGTQL
jgi:chemotaxis signal transduction protein